VTGLLEQGTSGAVDRLEPLLLSAHPGPAWRAGTVFPYRSPTFSLGWRSLGLDGGAVAATAFADEAGPNRRTDGKPSHLTG
jgi:hypothetical protein